MTFALPRLPSTSDVKQKAKRHLLSIFVIFAPFTDLMNPLTMFSTSKGYHANAACILVALLCYLSSANATETQEDTIPALAYDQLDLEARRVACRHDPTWLKVDYKDCQKLMGWKPRDTLWRQDKEHSSNWLNGKESKIEDCLKEAFENAKEKHEWAR